MKKNLLSMAAVLGLCLVAVQMPLYSQDRASRVSTRSAPTRTAPSSSPPPQRAAPSRTPSNARASSTSVQKHGRVARDHRGGTRIQTHRGSGYPHRHRGYGSNYHYGYYGSYYPFGFYGYYGYGSYWPSSYHNYYGLPYFWCYSPWFYWGGYYNSYQRPYHYSNWDSGAIDLNVKPKNTQVYLNGSLVGTTGKFDGFPDYLWLREGRHELIFYLEGHKTVRKIYEVVRETVWRERFQMVPGESKPVADLSKPPVPPKPAQDVARNTTREQHPNQDHPRARRRIPVEGQAQAAPASSGEGERGDLDLRGEPARLILNVVPGDATVYLDGKFLGAATDLANRSGDLIVDAGEHTLELLRPGYQTATRQIQLKAGELLTLDIALEKQP